MKPTNLSVQPPEAVGGRIYALMTVLKGQTEIEMLALNSKESFEDNKRYYRERAAVEDFPVISRLLEADARSLDRLQVQMATAREFFVLVRFRDEQDTDFRTQLSRVQKSLEDQGFKVTDVRFGPYGTELVLDGIDPQLLTRYDEAAADCIRAESAMKYFM